MPTEEIDLAESARIRSTKLVYLGGPIRHVRREAAMGWRQIMADKLYYANIASFNPAAAWMTPNHPTNGQHDPILEAHLQLANDVAVAFSDLAIFAYQGVESLGTDREIGLALSLGKPIVLYRHRIEGFSEWVIKRRLRDVTFFNVGEEHQMTGFIATVLRHVQPFPRLRLPASALPLGSTVAEED